MSSILKVRVICFNFMNKKTLICFFFHEKKLMVNLVLNLVVKLTIFKLMYRFILKVY